MARRGTSLGIVPIWVTVARFASVSNRRDKHRGLIQLAFHIWVVRSRVVKASKSSVKFHFRASREHSFCMSFHSGNRKDRSQGRAYHLLEPTVAEKVSSHGSLPLFQMMVRLFTI